MPENTHDPASSPEPSSRLLRLLWLAALVAVISACIWQWPRWLYLQTDVFWLIESGRFILAHNSLPSGDVFSYTFNGRPWVLYQWLFEILLALAYELGSWPAVSLLATVTTTELFFVFMPRSVLKAGTSALAALLVSLGCLAATMPDLVALRPQLLTFVLLFATQQSLDAYINNASTGRRALAWLPLIALIWANVHLSFVIEPLAIAVYLGFALWLKEKPVSPERPASAWRPLAIALSACLLATLVNPYGWHLYEFLFRSWQDYNLTPELRPLTEAGSWRHFLFMGLMAVAILWARTRLQPPAIALSMLLALAGLAGARFFIYFAVWSAPLLASALSEIARPAIKRSSILEEHLERALSEPLYPLGALCAAIAVTLMQPTYFPPSVPLEAADYLESNQMKGRLFASENAGSYLILRFHGNLPVFIDTRADVYGREFCERYRKLMLDGDGWAEAAREFDFSRALVPNRYKLKETIERSPGWEKTHGDKNYSLFEKRP